MSNDYQSNGYVTSECLVPADLLERAVLHMDAVIAGEYETGVEPHSAYHDPGNPDQLVKIDNALLCDDTIRELATHPELGAFVAQVMGAEMVQIWAMQLLKKPAGGKPVGNVGWHQDFQYWQSMWEPDSEVFTLWLAITDVTDDMGPMGMLRGSNQWGFLPDVGNFFDPQLDDHIKQIESLGVGPVEEVPMLLSAGEASLHHCHTFHGSGPNTSSEARRSIALHLRTEKSTILPGAEDAAYVRDIPDTNLCPVIYSS
jgi:ectoine hydroxylase-related dioxygenase (phytanoyl-CoA dioxygenase family)